MEVQPQHHQDATLHHQDLESEDHQCLRAITCHLMLDQNLWQLHQLFHHTNSMTNQVYLLIRIFRRSKLDGYYDSSQFDDGSFTSLILWNSEEILKPIFVVKTARYPFWVSKVLTFVTFTSFHGFNFNAVCKIFLRKKHYNLAKPGLD